MTKSKHIFLIAVLIVLSIPFVNCSKEEEKLPEPISTVNQFNSLQEALDAGTSVGAILVNNPIDSLYGKNYLGGLIFYVDSVNASGYISATTDQSSSAAWGCEFTTVVGVIDSLIGTGWSNTQSIEIGCTTPGTAADLCANLNLGGYSDWFLPSYHELKAMHDNLHINGHGNFTSSLYWSSTEYLTFEAMIYPFNGIPIALHLSGKEFPQSVRAIRAF